MRQALEIVQAVNRDSVGLTVDCINVYLHDKCADVDFIRKVPKDKLFVFHINDCEDLPLGILDHGECHAVLHAALRIETFELGHQLRPCSHGFAIRLQVHQRRVADQVGEIACYLFHIHNIYYNVWGGDACAASPPPGRAKVSHFLQRPCAVCRGDAFFVPAFIRNTGESRTFAAAFGGGRSPTDDCRPPTVDRLWNK